MSKISAVTLLFSLALLALSEGSEHTPPVDVELPEDAKALVDDFLKYISCLDGNCGNLHVIDHPRLLPTEQPASTEHTSTEQSSSTEKQEVTTPSDLSFCLDFMRLKESFENKHPELKPLKLKLLSYLDGFLTVYTANPAEKEEHLTKFLTSIIEIVQKLIVLVGKKETEEIIPTEVPVYPTEEIIAEEVEYPGFVGSVRGIPGLDYPAYTEVPITSFSCSDKKYVPGFYADVETRCQVFHVCYEHRRESFLCPVGTTFNQPILACDYWYSSNCSLSTHYYDVNAKKYEPAEVLDKTEENISQIITTIIAEEKPVLPPIHVKSKDTEILKSGLESILKFLPVKAKIVEFPVKPKVVPVKPIISSKLVKAAAVPIVKAKVAAAAAPVVKAKVAAIPIVKAKVAAAAAVPVVKSKLAAAAVPVVKAKVAAAAAVPVVKSKVAAAAAVPVIKAKVAALPVVKAKVASAAALKAKSAAKVIPAVKLAATKPKLVLSPLKAKAIVKGKAAMISPLTKKALALGYMKLLKAKKLALMG